MPYIMLPLVETREEIYLKMTINKHIILGSREKQHLLFSLVHLILC